MSHIQASPSSRAPSHPLGRLLIGRATGALLCQGAARRRLQSAAEKVSGGDGPGRAGLGALLRDAPRAATRRSTAAPQRSTGRGSTFHGPRSAPRAAAWRESARCWPPAPPPAWPGGWGSPWAPGCCSTRSRGGKEASRGRGTEPSMRRMAVVTAHAAGRGRQPRGARYLPSRFV